MKVSNKLIFNSEQPKDVQVNALNDNFSQLFQALTGRLRFGRSTTGDVGENFDGKFKSFTSDVTANTEFTVAHGLGSIPKGYLIFYQDKAGSLYQGPSTGTTWTTTNVYLKCSVSSVTFLVFFIP